MKLKKAQMQLSFGMIFSIILIIVFLSVAFYAITKFLNLKDNIQTGDSINKLQSDVDRIWKATQASESHDYLFPKKIKLVCFIDYTQNPRGKFTTYKEEDEIINIYDELERSMSTEGQNLFFYPMGSGGSINAYELKHINLTKIVEEDNPYCFENFRGKTPMVLKKEFGKKLVIIKRA